MIYNEDTRVKLPAIMHLTRLGYEYLSLKNNKWDKTNNVFTDIFEESIQHINPDNTLEEVKSYYKDISHLLDYDDLGRAFYEKLISQTGIKLIDFENFNNNSFHVVTELPCKNGDDEMRPDITLLINGMPLVFIEVKKPNNRKGIKAEEDRIDARFKNKNFKRFINITQLMIFSNNMKYNENASDHLQGAYYASTAYDKVVLNSFSEEVKFNLDTLLAPLDTNVEEYILRDNNKHVIKNNNEYITDRNPRTPTNSISTSLLQKERLAFILRYAIAYVQEEKLQKHIMRYPQLFATKAIERSLDNGMKKGIIWHTQGSGKTALAYYNVRYLTDYYSKKNIVPKFYFIVDRLDLLKQAKNEFEKRNLKVHIVNSRDEFARDIKKTTAVHNDKGAQEITVVNIQKFEDDPAVVKASDYNVNMQRIYILDEVHRSYNPKGSFLANLKESDPNAIKIGLTGTPLLGNDYNSRSLFGEYIHKYYYNQSIKDGYTLRLLREEISTEYKILLRDALDQIRVQQGDVPIKDVYAHSNYVKHLLKFIVEDFADYRRRNSDTSLGAMVICDSSKQAREMAAIFNEKYGTVTNIDTESSSKYIYDKAADDLGDYGDKKKYALKTAAIILHDIDSKEGIEQTINAYKRGEIDILFVYNMLLTGFDAKRLKKLYLGRVVKRHNLLQALTRVNRTYKDYTHGVVVDFADIKNEFDATNKAYYEELKLELGDDIEEFSDLFLSKDEIEEEIDILKDQLARYDSSNLSIFENQIDEIEDIEKLKPLRKALNSLREFYNIIRLLGYYDILENHDFQRLNRMQTMVDNRIETLRLKEGIEKGNLNDDIIDIALEEVIFKFVKVSTEELIIADELKNSLRRTREAFQNNFDKKDPQYISLKEELERLFHKKNLAEVTQEELKANIGALRLIHDKIKEINRQNDLLRTKYQNDDKYARTHKRLVEKGNITKTESKLIEALSDVKKQADDSVMCNKALLDNENYFERMLLKMLTHELLKTHSIKLKADEYKYVNRLVAKEYLNEYRGENAWM